MADETTPSNGPSWWRPPAIAFAFLAAFFVAEGVLRFVWLANGIMILVVIALLASLLTSLGQLVRGRWRPGLAMLGLTIAAVAVAMLFAAAAVFSRSTPPDPAQDGGGLNRPRPRHVRAA